MLDGGIAKTELQKVLAWDRRVSQGGKKLLSWNWHGTGGLHLSGKHVPQERYSVSEENTCTVTASQ